MSILFYSICQIKESDIWYKITENDCKNNHVQHLERTICSELYRIWKNTLLELDCNDYSLNSEVRKSMNWYDDSFRNIDNTNKYPDFVLHKGQGNKIQGNQLFACEVKTNSLIKNGVENDLKKFLVLMNNSRFQNAPFAYCVHIQIEAKNMKFQNNQFKRYEELEKLSLNDESSDCSHILLYLDKPIIDRIICVLISDNKSISIKTLNQLYKITDNNL